MQWNAEPYAGFSSAEPAGPVAPDYEAVNVDAQKRDPASMLTLFKRVIELRRGDEALALGGYAAVDAPEGVFAYTRGGKYTVALNFTDAVKRLDFGGEVGGFDAPRPRRRSRDGRTARA